MKTVLLTGATGFLGSHLLEALLERDYNVVILKRSTSDTSRINHLLNKVTSYDADCGQIEKAFEEQCIDIIIHTACHYGRNGDTISKVVESNLMYGSKVLDAALKFDVRTFINTDTLLIKELNAYTLSKKQFVEWLKQNGNKIYVVNLKLEHMYGPKDDSAKFVPWVLSEMIRNVPEIKLTLGKQQRDFIYVDDVVSAYMLFLEDVPNPPVFSEFDVGSGSLISVKDFLKKLRYIYEVKHGKLETYFDFGAIPYREAEQMTMQVDNSGLRKLGWNATVSLDEGLDRVVRGFA